MGDRIHRELMDFTDKVRRDPNHELRQSATRFLFEFADDLQNDPATIAKAESVKEQLMARDEVTRAAETAWRTLKRLVLEGVDDPSSALRGRIADSVVRIGESLREDNELRDKVDNWIVRAAQHLVGQYGVEITVDHHRDDRALGRRGRQPAHRTARRPGPAIHPDQRHRGGCAGRAGDLHSGANHILTCASNCLQELAP